MAHSHSNTNAKNTRSSSVTCRDIGRKVGCSGNTVSLALRGDPRVKQSTRRLIHMVAKQMKYRPLASARALQAGRTHTIGVIFSGLAKRGEILFRVYAQALQCIAEALIRQNYHVSLATAPEIRATNDTGPGSARLFSEEAVDGALVIQQPALGLLETLEGQALPLVVVDGGPVPGRDGVSESVARRTEQECICVRSDHKRAAEMLVEHLVALGHKAIALNSTVMVRYRGRQFVDGYLRAVAAAGLPAVSGWDRWDHSKYPAPPPRTYVDVEYLEELFSLAHPPTAIITSNDQEAAGVMSWLLMRGLSVPKDVSVAALQDLGVMAEMPEPCILPRVTGKENMQEQLASVAVEKLLHLIEHPNEAVDSVVLDPKLIVRESTGTCRNGQKS